MGVVCLHHTLQHSKSVLVDPSEEKELTAHHSSTMIGPSSVIMSLIVCLLLPCYFAEEENELKSTKEWYELNTKDQSWTELKLRVRFSRLRDGEFFIVSREQRLRFVTNWPSKMHHLLAKTIMMMLHIFLTSLKESRIYDLRRNWWTSWDCRGHTQAVHCPPSKVAQGEITYKSVF